MDILNVTPPEVNPVTKAKGFWKQLGMLVLGTTVSLVLTFGTAQLINKGQRAKDRRLTALMVMSNIESFAQQLDSIYNIMDEADTASTWLLSRPIEQIDLLPSQTLSKIFDLCYLRTSINYDKTTENIFSNNIDTWKNMGNFQFIDNVGKCFSTMHFFQEYWNNFILEIEATTKEVDNKRRTNPDGNSLYVWCLKDPSFVLILRRLHNFRNWICESADKLRYLNRQNMAAIGISQEEVLSFLDSRRDKIVIDEIPTEQKDLAVPRPDPAQLTSYKVYDSIIRFAVEP